MTRDVARVELRQGDVRALEVVEDGDHVRVSVYDEDLGTIPLIAARLSRDERRRLVSALLAVDITSARRRHA